MWRRMAEDFGDCWRALWPWEDGVRKLMLCEHVMREIRIGIRDYCRCVINLSGVVLLVASDKN